MRRTPWTTYLWPGLPQLWIDGAWSGLALAVGFGLLLDLLMLASWVWVELVDPPLVSAGWLMLGLVWMGSAILSMHTRRSTVGQLETHPAEDLFRGALAEYLKGNWLEAEKVLVRLLADRPRDIEARLLLATLLRHTRRYREAADQLRRLEALDGAEKWAPEIAREKRLIVPEEPNLSELLGKTLEGAGLAELAVRAA